jgi:hypothetical protein
MANQGSSPVERTVSFILPRAVSLLLPGWGLVMIVPGLMRGDCDRTVSDKIDTEVGEVSVRVALRTLARYPFPGKPPRADQFRRPDRNHAEQFHDGSLW